MKPEAKMILLERKFLSIEYMDLYVELYKKMVDSLERGMNAFFEQQKVNPDINADNIASWVEMGLPTLKGSVARAQQALERARMGDIQGISSSAGNLKGLSKDVDNIGGFGDWWHEVPEHRKDFFAKKKEASRVGCNIYYTDCQHWRPGSILKESITGPIDENELLNYLKPGETLDDLD